MDNITVGEILKPKGIKGAVKVRPLTDDMHRFDCLKLVYIDGKSYPIEAVSYECGFLILSLSNVSDRNAAELLRGKTIQIDRVHAVDPGLDRYFVSDIVNCMLLDEFGKTLGVILDVESFGAADVITGEGGGKIFRFPFLNRIVQQIDVKTKRFCVYRKLWKEVAVFDD